MTQARKDTAKALAMDVSDRASLSGVALTIDNERVGAKHLRVRC